MTRGLGQLTEAIAYGYDKAVMVTTLSRAKRIDPRVFVKSRFILLGVDSSGIVKQLSPNQ